jgi:hypothetical protein
MLVGRIEPEVLAGYTIKLSTWYNKAKILPERNNHGHVIITILNNDSLARDRVMKGLDGNLGWMSSARGKALMYDSLVEELRSASIIIHDEETKTQLANVEGTTLRAAEGDHDDRAVAFALAVTAAVMKPSISFSYPYMEQRKTNGDRRRLSLSGSPYRG